MTENEVSAIAEAMAVKLNPLVRQAVKALESIGFETPDEEKIAREIFLSSMIYAMFLDRKITFGEIVETIGPAFATAMTNFGNLDEELPEHIMGAAVACLTTDKSGTRGILDFIAKITQAALYISVNKVATVSLAKTMR
ncbi:MAG: hypothetical protein K2J70_06725 [Muribaculaceae bacterium]|nr:hypothetical protein [Muribaculaceae bacterium]